MFMDDYMPAAVSHRLHFNNRFFTLLLAKGIFHRCLAPFRVLLAASFLVLRNLFYCEIGCRSQNNEGCEADVILHLSLLKIHSAWRNQTCVIERAKLIYTHRRSVSLIVAYW